MVVLVCGLFLLGLIVARLGFRVPLIFGLVSVLLAATFRRGKMVRLAFLCLAALSLGVWRGGAFYAELAPYRQFAYQKVTVEVTALEDAVYATGGQLSFTVGSVTFTSPHKTPAKGQIKIKGYGELAVYRGDRLTIDGKLYPTRGAAQASMSYVQMKRIGSTQSIFDNFRRRFGAGLQTALPEPLASFAMGLLVGQRNTLPDDITTALKMVGLTHIIAVSGYNLTIMLDFARKRFGKHSKLGSTIGAVALMLGFIAITGASASIVRAAVVSAIGLAAWYVGRTVRPMVVIMLAAALTAGYNPVYIWSDIGWYLSFLAFFGILMLALQITKRIWRDREPSAIASVAVETVSAELMTIPLIMFIFGQVSLVGLAANVLVVSFIPLAMLLSFIVGLAGMIMPLLVGWIALPLKWLLTYMLDVASLLSKVPHGFRTNVYLTVFDMIFCYAAIVFLLAWIYRPRRPHWFDDTTIEKQ
jgi:competence protein ComEC